MTNAPHDGNHVPGLIAALNTDGKTVAPITADPSSHGIMVNDGTTGIDHGPPDAIKDENHVSGMLALSSAGDKKLVSLYATSDGSLLIDSM